jgi:acyl-coenzyme A synthetase/AMP-(fatty) acid ligase/acyl carrier protein
MIEHAGLTNLSQAQSQAFELTQRSRVLQFASLNFDASVSELATTLISGATLVLGSTQKILPNDSFVQLINQQAITHVTLPPSFLTAMSPVSLPSLKTLVVAGETCASELVSKWSPGRQFINAYGPTESTVCATLTECASDGNPPPIGKPIANIQIYLLDANQNLTPLGLPGELCIAGAGLARGYLNRPDLTAEKFVELELFGIRQRVYKTGDLARWLPDGNLEYLGRLDHQIKLRGFRIELGEIEAVLTQHEAVKEAVVVLLEKESHPRLAAYVTTRNLTGLSDRSDFTTVLRAWLKIRLPEYMVPTSVTVLEQLPLTPNGKIDRNALFQLSATPALSAGEWVAPRTPEEKLLAEIWTTVLGIERVGIHQNFFDLGGHSLLLIQVQAKVSAAFDQPLSVLELFEYPTIQTLAQHLTATSSKPTLSTRAEHRRTRQTAMRHQRQTRTQHRSKNHD